MLHHFKLHIIYTNRDMLQYFEITFSDINSGDLYISNLANAQAFQYIFLGMENKKQFCQLKM